MVTIPQIPRTAPIDPRTGATSREWARYYEDLRVYLGTLPNVVTSVFGRSGAVTAAAGDYSVSKGGTGGTSFTDGGLLVGSGTSAITALARMGDSVIVVGASSGDPGPLTINASTIFGRKATGSAVALTATETRTILNVENGSTADQTGAEIKTAYEGEADTNAYTDSEKTVVGNTSGTNTGDEVVATTATAGVVKEATAIADLNQTITAPPTQGEVQDISDKIDALLAVMRTAGQLST